MEFMTLIKALKEELKKDEVLQETAVSIVGDEVYLEREAWNLRALKCLIPVLDKLKITFFVFDHQKLLMYSLEGSKSTDQLCKGK